MARLRTLVGVLLLLVVCGGLIVAARRDQQSAGTTLEAPRAMPSEVTHVLSGRSIFRRSCRGCHLDPFEEGRRAPGPDLNQVHPDYARTLRAVRLGIGTMPAFEGRLTATQIDDVARYVVFAVNHPHRPGPPHTPPSSTRLALGPPQR